MTGLLVVAIYLSFVYDFVLAPIPSEASTLNLVTTPERVSHWQRPLLRLGLGFAHAGLLALWLYPLLMALIDLIANTCQPSGWLPWAGIFLAFAGRCVTVAASLELRRRGTASVVSSGVFAFSRHPIVVGLHLTLFGLLVGSNSLYCLLVFPLTLVYFHQKVQIEENALLQRFGSDYKGYAKVTPRYLLHGGKMPDGKCQTTKMESEEKLAIDWLAQRDRFDQAARDQALLHQALQLLKDKPNPDIADLGAGTGNNAMSLAPHLPEGCLLTLVEQHDYLLQACQQRFAEAQHPLPQTSFVQQDLHQWLAGMPSVDLICNSALLDLMTETELAVLLQRLKALDTPMYSTLNYTGVKFVPAQEADTHYITLFEKHMSRELDRGQPLGASTMDRLAVLCDETGLQLYTAPSVWQITSDDAAFMQMNLGFYQRGIEAQLTKASQTKALSTWFAGKQAQLAKGALTLHVLHQDVLVVPPTPH